MKLALLQFVSFSLFISLSLSLSLLPTTLFAVERSKPTPYPDSKYEVYSRKHSPGMAVMILKDGNLLEAKGFGYAKMPPQLPIDGSTNFQLASNTKAFTAAAILLLEQDGRISENDLVSKFIPELPSGMKTITIFHLLHHLAGLPEYGDALCSETPGTSASNEDVVNFLKTQQLHFPPGRQFEYSNTGYVLLAEVLHRMTQKSYPEVMKERIFDPLSMSQSRVYTQETATRIPNRAISYGSWPWFNEYEFDSCNTLFGEGGIYTSAEDYAKWARSLENGTLFQPEYQAKIWAAVKTNDGKTVPYGYGWGIEEYNGEPMIAHAGLWLGARSLAGYFPRRHLWIAISANFLDVPMDDVLDDYFQAYR